MIKEVFGKKVLVMGLGLLGGGLSVVRWLATHGADVTVTDMKTAKELAPSVEKLKDLSNVTFVFGEHRKENFLDHDLIMVNPGVPKESEYLAVAREVGIPIENDASMFLRLAESPVIGVTGTRGKTTATKWISELLEMDYPTLAPSGNIPDNPLLAELERATDDEKRGMPHVTELSSWQLERVASAKRSPEIAVITNIYRDHMNRYESLEEYVDAKANIFIHQLRGDRLILNYENEWREFFIEKLPRAHITYTSLSPLPDEQDGLYYDSGDIFCKRADKRIKLGNIRQFEQERGMHNVSNLLFALSAVAAFRSHHISLGPLCDPDDAYRNECGEIAPLLSRVNSLTEVRFRQEVVHSDGNLTIVNDATATTPHAGIAAIRRFTPRDRVVLLAGGTDKDLEYEEWADEVNEKIHEHDLFLLAGSGTDKMQKALKESSYHSSIKPEDHFETVTKQALERAKELASHEPVTLLFSPGGSSFEKFKHEFERGETFNELIQKSH